MLYFVPAWYKENQWCENEEYWYRRRTHSEFDETIKQLQLFRRNMKVDYEILLLSYAPNFRHFLHRQGLFRASYWSCFDSIQQIQRSRIAVLSFHDIKWPEGVEFIYSPFAITVLRGGERFAQVEFGEDGNPISIDMFENDQICRRNLYDDRGFVSLTTVYEDGQAIHKDYLMENGTWKLREYVRDGHVEVNPNCPQYSITHEGMTEELTFASNSYPNMKAVIEEVFQSYIANTNKEDVFFVAVHKLHAKLLEEILKGRHMIATLFEQRVDYQKDREISGLLSLADYVITDSADTTDQLLQQINISEKKIRDISPYDTRVDFGISSQLSVQNILIPIDGIDDALLDKILVETCKYLKKNSKARVHVFTRNAGWGVPEQIANRIVDVIIANGFDKRWVVESQTSDGENAIDGDEKKVELRFFIDQCVDERSISKCLNEQRVILDFRNAMDVFLSITAISKGVPRITSSLDQYVSHKENGWLIEDTSEIGNVLTYYLDSLENWNAALVSCYEISQKYTTNVLIDAWKEVLRIVE